MNRAQLLLKHINTDGQGVEIAPYFNPTLRKSDGFNILTVDVFDTETLLARAAKDTHIDTSRIDEIETVDLVGDASNIGAMLASRDLDGQVDYIISSHNFEHLPNPIKFLQGACRALRDGGVLAVAVPDCRFTFDHFRMPTRLADWLQAFEEDRSQPSAETLFDAHTNTSSFVIGGVKHVGMVKPADDPNKFEPEQTLRQSYQNYISNRSDLGTYTDAHCSVFFGESLELMIRDLAHLNLIDFEVIEVVPTLGIEFFMHLRKVAARDHTATTETVFYARRRELLNKMADNIGRGGLAQTHGNSARRNRYIARRSEQALKAGISRAFGSARAKALDRWWLRKRGALEEFFKSK